MDREGGLLGLLFGRNRWVADLLHASRAWKRSLKTCLCALPPSALQAINFEVPWLSPLVPWQPAAAPVIVPTQPAPSAAEEAAEESGEAAAGGSSGGSARRLHGKAAEDDASAGGGKEKDQGQGQKEGPEQRAAPAASPVPPPPPGPPLPPPGENATVLLAELDRASKGEYPRHICIQVRMGA